MESKNSEHVLSAKKIALGTLKKIAYITKDLARVSTLGNCGKEAMKKFKNEIMQLQQV